MALFRFFVTAAVRHLGFLKDQNFNIWYVSKDQFVSPRQISCRSVKRLRHLGFVIHLWTILSGIVSEILPHLLCMWLAVTFRSPSVSKRQLKLQVTCAFRFMFNYVFILHRFIDIIIISQNLKRLRDPEHIPFVGSVIYHARTSTHMHKSAHNIWNV